MDRPLKLDRLITRLQEFRAKHGNMDVFVTWEGQETELTLYRDQYGKLLIDADGNSYRARFEHPDDAATMLAAEDESVIELREPGALDGDSSGEYWAGVTKSLVLDRYSDEGEIFEFSETREGALLDVKRVLAHQRDKLALYGAQDNTDV